jgi:predicted HAD superfamily hydrolase
MSKPTYSFDVFDTCVTRTYAHPRDLFYELGLRVAPPNLANKEKQRFAIQFQRLRIQAEKTAHRRAKPRHTVTLKEIYEHFSIPSNLSTEIDDLVQAELDLECESIYPIPSMISRLEELRKTGNRIIFISDMYIPSSLLAPILKERGVMKEQDVLYVSCDAGVTKHHGQLFHHVLKAEGLEGAQLIHTGDNLRADIRMATNANIKAAHFRDGMLTPYEADMAGHRLPRHRAKSFQAALARRLRLSVPPNDNPENIPLDHVIHGIVVPLLLCYVMWVLDHAKRNGICRLYFVARDAEIMLQIAKALQGEDETIQLRYLYGSRRAWLPPSIIPGNADWQRLLLISGQASSRRDIIARMGLDDETQETARSILSCSAAEWSSQLSRDQADAFLAELPSNALISELIHSSISHKRELALSYFEQEGLFDDVSWALVDAGWSLNAQSALKRVLAASKTKHQAPRGYYLALARDHLSEAQAGIAYPFVSRAGSIFSRRRVIIEHCFLPSTHATTRGYQLDGDRIAPIFGNELRGDMELSYAKKLHDAATSAAHMIAANPAIASSLREHTGEILSSAARFLKHPRKSDARAMATFGTVSDMRHEKSFVEPLCRRLDFKDVWRVLSMTVSMKKNFKAPSFMWLEGSVALSPLPVRIPLKWLLGLDSLRQWLRDRR